MEMSHSWAKSKATALPAQTHREWRARLSSPRKLGAKSWGCVGMGTCSPGPLIPLWCPLLAWELESKAGAGEEGNLSGNEVSISIIQLILDPHYHTQSKTAWMHQALSKNII